MCRPCRILVTRARKSCSVHFHQGTKLEIQKPKAQTQPLNAYKPETSSRKIAFEERIVRLLWDLSRDEQKVSTSWRWRRLESLGFGRFFFWQRPIVLNVKMATASDR